MSKSMAVFFCCFTVVTIYSSHHLQGKKMASSGILMAQSFRTFISPLLYQIQYNPEHVHQSGLIFVNTFPHLPNRKDSITRISFGDKKKEDDEKNII